MGVCKMTVLTRKWDCTIRKNVPSNLRGDAAREIAFVDLQVFKIPKLANLCRYGSFKTCIENEE